MSITRAMTLWMMCIMAISGMVAQELPEGFLEADSLPPYVIVVDGPEEVTSLPDSVFNLRAGRVIFGVNRVEVSKETPFMKELNDKILPLANQCCWTLSGIELRGAASPEGPYDNNVRLSRERAAALIEYISPRLDAKTKMEIVPVTIAEDYPYLLWMLERRGDSAAAVVRRIIEKYGMDHPARIKEALQRQAGGALWARLLKDYFPHMRAARIILYFTPVERISPILDDVEVPDATMRVYQGAEAILPPDLHFPMIIERQHMLSASTNVLYDAFYMPQYGWAPMPNVQIEFYPRRGRFTYRAGFTFPYYHRWAKHKFFQIRDYHLEVRRYFEPGLLHTGMYLGAYVNASKYGIGLSAKKGWQGEGIGGALKFGYVLPLGSGRWRMDLHVAAGCYVTRFDPYVYGNPVTGEADGDYYYDWTLGADTFHKRNHRFKWFGPTEVGVTFTYDLLYWRIRQKGASMLRKEVLW